jgi:serine/threonine-protein kinase
MSPEQFETDQVDHRADIYALGVVAFELFTGHRPFEADNPVILAVKHASEKPKDPLELNPELPPRLAAVILTCLEKSPRARFNSVGEISSCLLGSPPASVDVPVQDVADRAEEKAQEKPEEDAPPAAE